MAFQVWSRPICRDNNAEALAKELKAKTEIYQSAGSVYTGKLKEELRPFANADVPKVSYPTKLLYRIGFVKTECIHYFGTGKKEDAWDLTSLKADFINEVWSPSDDILRVKPWLLLEFEKETTGHGTHKKLVEFYNLFAHEFEPTHEVPSD